MIVVALALCAAPVLSVPLSEFVNWGAGAGDAKLPPNDDLSSERISLNPSFTLWGETYSSLFVNTNGVISFDGPVSTYTPIPIPLDSFPTLLPFWADFDVRPTGPNLNEVWYRQETSDAATLAQVNDLVRSSFPGSFDFNAEYAFIATWHRVGYYNKKTDKLNTLQCVVTSDMFSRSFVFFLYDSITWSFGDVSGGVHAEVGFNKGSDGVFYRVEASRTSAVFNLPQTSNVGRAGLWAFQVDGPQVLPPCDPGYERATPGAPCTEVDECAKYQPCVRGTCQDGINSYTCFCPAGWVGQHCDTPTNECSPDPCANGNCVDLHLDYRCDCAPGWQGRNCDVPTNECFPDPCRNGATCVDLHLDYRCDCAPGWEGRNCETNTDACDPNPCVRGTCTDLIPDGAYTCSCPPGFSGTNCQVDVDTCQDDTCVHGTCVDLVGLDFECDCDPGWEGSTCGTSVDDCSPNPCLNGGSCQDGHQSFTCSCPPDFTGTVCGTRRAPIVSGIAPTTGSAGTRITITAAHLGSAVGQLSATVAGVDCPIDPSSLTATTVVCTAPALCDGVEALVVLTHAAGGSASHPYPEFTYTTSFVECDGSLAFSCVNSHVLGDAASKPAGLNVFLKRGDPLTVPLSVYPPSKAADLLFVQDLSASFSDDLPFIRSGIRSLFIEMAGTEPVHPRFGMVSFVDFPGSGASSSDYPYKVEQVLTGSQSQLVSAMDAYSTLNGGDSPDAQLHALYTLAQNPASVSFFADRQSFAVVVTDSPYHQGGQYPTADATRRALLAANILPLFVVTPAVRTVYDNLVASWGFGAVATLTSNSGNIATAVKAALADARDSLDVSFGPTGDHSYAAIGASSACGPDGQQTMVTLSQDSVDAADQSFSIVTPGFGTTSVDVVINERPTTAAPFAPIVLDEDSSAVIEFAGNDREGNPLVFEITSLPQRGTLRSYVNGVPGNSLSVGSRVPDTAASVLFAPTPDEYDANEYATFTFVADDGASQSIPRTVTIKVNPRNDVPTVLDATATTDEDTALAIDLSTLQVTAAGSEGTITSPAVSDVDGDDLSLIVTSLPAKGTLARAGGGAITPGQTLPAFPLTFTPAADQYGDPYTTFGFKVTDGRATSLEGTFTVSVNSVNDAVTAQSITRTLDEDAPATAITLPVADADPEDSIDVRIVSLPSDGTLTQFGGAAITAPNTRVTDSRFRVKFQPAADAFGSPLTTFTFTATDGTVTTPERTVTVNVSPLNDAPVLGSNPSVVTTDEDTSVTISLSGTDADPSDAPRLQVVSFVGSGSLEGNPADGQTVEGTSVVYVPAANDFGTGRATLVARLVDDAGATSASHTFRIDVSSVNDVPVATAATAVTVPEDSVRAVVLSATDIDADALTATVTAVSGPYFFPASSGGSAVGASAVVAGNARLGEASLFFRPGADEFGSDYASLTYTVADGNGGTSGARTITFSVTNVNDAPVASLSPNPVTALEDADETIVLAVSDADVDAGVDSVTASIVSLPSRGSLRQFDGTPITAPGTDVTDGSHRVLYRSAPNDHSNRDTFSFRFRDAAGTASNTVTARVDVTPTPDAPVAVAATASTSEDRPVTFALRGTDVDLDALVARITSLPASGVLRDATTDAVIGSVPFALTGDARNSLAMVMYEPNLDTNGVDSFDFEVFDGATASAATASAVITVAAINDAPTTSVSGATTIVEDTETVLVLETADVDVPEGDELQQPVVRSLPTRGALLQVTGASTPGAPITTVPTAVTNGAGRVLFRPAANDNGAPYSSFAFDVQDTAGATSELRTVQLTVTPANDPPTASVVANPALASQSTVENPQFTGMFVQASDIDGDALTAYISSLPLDGKLYADAEGTTLLYDPDTMSDIAPLELSAFGVFYEPRLGQSGTLFDSFEFLVEDGDGEQATAVQNIDVVVLFNRPRVVVSTTTLALDEDDTASLTVNVQDDDVDDTLTLSVSALPSNGVLRDALGAVVESPREIEPGTLTYEPAADWFGDDSFVLVASDGIFLSSPVTVNVAVASVNDRPLAADLSATTLEDESVVVTLRGSDVENDDLVARIVTAPGAGRLLDHGTDAVLGDGSLVSAMQVRFEPAADENGASYASFSYELADVPTSGGAALTSAAATVSVAVVAQNDAPTASIDANPIETDEDTPVLVQLGGDDADADDVGQLVALVSFDAGEQGTLSQFDGTVIEGDDVAVTDAQMRVRYTPAADQNGVGVAELVFRIRDPQDTFSSVLTVPVNVAAVNDPPIASIGQNPVTTAEDTEVTMLLVGSDVDTATNSDTIRAIVTAVPAAATEGVLRDSEGATLAPGSELPADNTVTFVPAADANGAGLASFAFVFEDAQGERSSAVDVVINVDAVNDDPTGAGASVTLNEDTTVTVALANDDVDAGESLTTIVVRAPSNGELVATGTEAEYTYTPLANFFGTDSFDYVVEDASGARSSVYTVDLTVDATNDVPIASIATNPVQATEETVQLITLEASDIDGDDLTMSIDSFSGSGALFQANGDGSVGASIAAFPTDLTDPSGFRFHYEPVANDFGTGVAAFTFAVRDAEATSEAVAATIDVANVNDLPTATLVGPVVTTEDVPVTVELTCSDLDGDAPLTATITGLPTPGALYQVEGDGSRGALIEAADTLVVDGDNRVMFVSGLHEFSAPETGLYATFAYACSDGQADSAAVDVEVDVVSENDIPTALAMSVETSEDTGVFVQLFGEDADGDLLDLVVVTPPLNGELRLLSGDALPGDGVAPLGEVEFHPAPDAHGVIENEFAYDTFVYVARDPSGAESAPTTVSVAVYPVNDRPTVAIAGAVVTDEDTVVSVPFVVSDVDSSDVSFAIAVLPTVGTLLSANGEEISEAGEMPALGLDSELQYVPPADVFGDAVASFVVYATDGIEPSVEQTVTVSVRSINDIPVAVGPDAGILREDESSVIVLKGTDVDGDALSVQIETLPTHGTLALVDGTEVEGPQTVDVDDSGIAFVLYTPDRDQHGDAGDGFLFDAFTFSVNDGAVDSEAQEVPLRVSPVNDPPSLEVVAAIDVDEDGRVLVEFVSADVDGDETTVFLTSAPRQGALYTVGSDGGLGSLVLEDTEVSASSLFYVPPLDGHDGTFLYREYLRLQSTDGELVSDKRTTVIGVAATNDAPVVSFQTNSTAGFFDSALVVQGVEVSDVDFDDARSAGFEVTVSIVCAGELSVADVAGIQFDEVESEGTTVIMTGPLAAINVALEQLDYMPPSMDVLSDNVVDEEEDVFFDEIVVTVTDLGNVGAGGALSSTATHRVVLAPRPPEPEVGPQTEDSQVLPVAAGAAAAGAFVAGAAYRAFKKRGLIPEIDAFAESGLTAEHAFENNPLYERDPSVGRGVHANPLFTAAPVV